MIPSVRSMDVISPCPELGKRTLENAKKTIKYCWKYDSLQHSCIWSLLLYYSDLEVCWHGEALNLEELSTKDILVPADTEMEGPVVQLPTPAQPQAGSDSNNHIQSAHSSSHSSSPACNTDTVAVDKTHTLKFLLCTKIGLTVLVFVAVSLRQLIFLTWNISVLRSLQQHSFWLGKKNLTKPPWVLVVTLSVLSS